MSRCYWVVLILSATVYVCMLAFLPETYPPRLLQLKAQRLGIEYPRLSLKVMIKTNLTRPCIMFFTEPILFLLSLYMAFLYGILYLDFTAYPYVFQEIRHWSVGISGLAFLGKHETTSPSHDSFLLDPGIGVGMAIVSAISPYVNRIYGRYVEKLGGPVPEARLPHLIIIAWLVPIGLFWFAWTSSASIHWASCIIAGVPYGFGFVSLFLGITSYLIDCYGRYAASALAANAILRSLFGAVFPLFSRQMYDDLGTGWGTSLLGFVALAMTPMPYVFYHYGPKIRARSAFHQMTMDQEKKEAEREELRK